MASSSSSQSLIDKVNAYYKNSPNLTDFIVDPPADNESASTAALEQDIKDLNVNETDRVEALCKEFLYIGGPDVTRNSKKKEELPKQQNASITDKVAKESSDSTASSHDLHDEENQATSGGNVAASAHKANPGPVKADNLPTPESKENLKKRAEELNK
ncbi:hypothetical protein N0V83_005995 [Neocucurbitaria cava]|uniref:Uncharacterized protein n=1 Tax=Neocucurbitaria cava TaxID=798079 RepID=A0A9W8Y5W0_9PLEO|nr:hypothetical protein N0V83_005995 [Neocucurbitaria cava]